MYGAIALATICSARPRMRQAETGERVWHFQLTHHDLWTSIRRAPILRHHRDGRPSRRRAGTKQAFAYVFDRVTGKPVCRSRNGRPAIHDARGATSPTQPSRQATAFDRQGSTIDNLIDFTPELRQEAIAITKQYVTGPTV